MQPFFDRIQQISLVVKNSRATAQRFWDELGIGPWMFYRLDPANTPEMMLRGTPVEHSFLAAVASVGGVELELIEPLDGESIYAEHLRERGEGLHHIAIHSGDAGRAIRHLANLGYGELQSGKTLGVGRYSYFDTEKRLGCILELGEISKGTTLPAPEFTLPADISRDEGAND
jgi:hypothetical protein